MTESLKSLYFAELTSADVAELTNGDSPIVLLWPVGATEPHGPHAPLATDTLISQSTCERAARRLADDPELTALVLPSLPYGVTRYSAGFAGAVSITEGTLKGLVGDVCRSLAEQGLGRVVVVNNHFEPEQMHALRQAVQTLQDDGIGAALLDLLRRDNVERLTDEFQAGEAHAGSYETSMVLADYPDLVDAERMRELPPVHVDMAAAIAAGKSDFTSMGMTAGYAGAPAQATAEEGEHTLDTLADLVVELARHVAGRA